MSRPIGGRSSLCHIFHHGYAKQLQKCLLLQWIPSNCCHEKTSHWSHEQNAPHTGGTWHAYPNSEIVERML